MRYFWGFVQLQDMIDNAIIEIKTDMVSHCCHIAKLCPLIAKCFAISKSIFSNLKSFRRFRTGYFFSNSRTPASGETISSQDSTLSNLCRLTFKPYSILSDFKSPFFFTVFGSFWLCIITSIFDQNPYFFL